MSQPGTAGIVAASAGTIFNFAVWSRGASANVYTQGQREPSKCLPVTGKVVNPDAISIATNSVPFARIGMTISANGGQEGSGIRPAPCTPATRPTSPMSYSTAI